MYRRGNTNENGIQWIILRFATSGPYLTQHLYSLRPGHEQLAAANPDGEY
jgi:hypothetical protein